VFLLYFIFHDRRKTHKKPQEKKKTQTERNVLLVPRDRSTSSLPVAGMGKIDHLPGLIDRIRPSKAIIKSIYLSIDRSIYLSFRIVSTRLVLDSQGRKQRRAKSHRVRLSDLNVQSGEAASDACIQSASILRDSPIFCTWRKTIPKAAALTWWAMSGR
jgi:hypothetical protein